jgi:riboflavin kinase/FMN adenylyltransferase
VGENKLTSSKIKQYLMNGDLLKVNKSLTSPYYVYGEVIHGNKNGGKLGFKTANIKLEDNLVALKEGSYIGFSSVNKKMYQSAIFIRNGILESHILNGFNKNIYGKRLIVYPLLFTRPITKVNSFEELRKTITKKIKEIQTLFSKF